MITYAAIYPQAHLAELEQVAEVREAIADGLRRSNLEGFIESRAFAVQEQLPISNVGNGNGLRRNCDEEWIYALLTGDVTPCCQIKTPPSDQWNLFRRPIDEILADPLYENIRFNLWNGLFLPECQGCGKTCG